MSIHIDQLVEGFERLEKELRREHTSARVKAALVVMRSRVDEARRWQEQSGPVQREIFDDTEKIVRAPYSDRGNSLDAASGTIVSGAAKRLRRWCLVRLEQGSHTSDELEAHLEKIRPGRAWHSSVSARLNGLVGDGLALVDGKRKTRAGRDAGVYWISAKGVEFLAKERAK